MVVDEVLPVAAADGLSENMVWLGDSRAPRHVCNDLGLMLDVRVRDNPIQLLVQVN